MPTMIRERRWRGRDPSRPLRGSIALSNSPSPLSPDHFTPPHGSTGMDRGLFHSVSGNWRPTDDPSRGFFHVVSERRTRTRLSQRCEWTCGLWAVAIPTRCSWTGSEGAGLGLAIGSWMAMCATACVPGVEDFFRAGLTERFLAGDERCTRMVGPSNQRGRMGEKTSRRVAESRAEGCCESLVQRSDA